MNVIIVLNVCVVFSYTLCHKQHIIFSQLCLQSFMFLKSLMGDPELTNYLFKLSFFSRTKLSLFPCQANYIHVLIHVILEIKNLIQCFCSNQDGLYWHMAVWMTTNSQQHGLTSRQIRVRKRRLCKNPRKLVCHENLLVNHSCDVWLSLTEKCKVPL